MVVVVVAVVVVLVVAEAAVAVSATIAASFRRYGQHRGDAARSVAVWQLCQSSMCKDVCDRSYPVIDKLRARAPPFPPSPVGALSCG